MAAAPASGVVAQSNKIPMRVNKKPHHGLSLQSSNSTAAGQPLPQTQQATRLGQQAILAQPNTRNSLLDPFVQ